MFSKSIVKPALTILLGVGVIALAPPVGVIGSTPPVALMERYCIDCHDDSVQKGDLDLNSILRDPVGAHPAMWEKVVRKMSARQMPPVGKDRPDEAGYDAGVTELESALDAHAAEHPHAGRTETLRRLTRTEYQNAVRDLLAVDIDASALLPVDEASHGFDNITVGDLPPALLDRYITAAEKIARMAMGSVSDKPDLATHRVPPDITQEEHVPGLPFGTRGGVLIRHAFPQAGEYEVRVRLQRDRNELVEGLRGTHELLVLLDREEMTELEVKPAKGRDHSQVDAGLVARFHAEAGPHELGVTFVRNGEPLLERMRQPYEAGFNYHRHPRLSPAVYQVTITGPFDPKGPGETPSRRRILIAKPEGHSQEEECAEKILAHLLRRAWRRPVSDDDVARVMPFFQHAEDFESGIEAALAAILVSPEFLFRVENDPPTAKPGEVYALSDLELATRLSFFLWSSLPDEDLMAAAEKGELSPPGQLTAQARRMLSDPRAQALVTNFADQWLYLRNLDSFTPDARLFPDFDQNLREALKKETQHLVADVIQNDRSLLELLRTDRTWLNERLAKHYGIPHVEGSRFREVAVEPEWHRGGLLRQGSILAVTSYATRTSPVLRGHWILTNLVGAPPPPPPPDVPALDEVINASLPIRERLAQHRENAACAGCHAPMDPVGFALENYDAIGRWNDWFDGRPADNQGGFADGSTFEGVTGLEQVLLDRPELFVGALTEKLVTYALGRGIEAEDGPAIRAVVRHARKHDWQFSELVAGIVTSVPFTHRTR